LQQHSPGRPLSQPTAEQHFMQKLGNKDVKDSQVLQGQHSPNVSTILLRFFYDFSKIIPRAHFPAFPR
jgi:hypothetical protein